MKYFLVQSPKAELNILDSQTSWKPFSRSKCAAKDCNKVYANY